MNHKVIRQRLRQAIKLIHQRTDRSGYLQIPQPSASRFKLASLQRTCGVTARARDEIRPLLEAVLAAAKLSSVLANQPLQAGSHGPGRLGPADFLIVPAGGREEAFAFIENWLDRSAPSYLKISDPYFAPPDLDVIKLIQAVAPTCQLQIITSRKVQEAEQLRPTVEEAYRNHWRQISDVPPPDAEIVIVGYEPHGEALIHERYMVGPDGAHKFGGSFNGLGRGKQSDIAVLNKFEASEIEHDLDRILSKQIRMHNGVKVKYNTFDL